MSYGYDFECTRERWQSPVSIMARQESDRHVLEKASEQPQKSMRLSSVVFYRLSDAFLAVQSAIGCEAHRLLITDLLAASSHIVFEFLKSFHVVRSASDFLTSSRIFSKHLALINLVNHPATSIEETPVEEDHCYSSIGLTHA